MRQFVPLIRADDPPIGLAYPPEHSVGRLTRLAKNSVANLLRLGAGWVVILVVPPLLVRLLDRASYATWMLVLQVGAYATLFDGGLQLAIGRYVARAERTAEPNYLGRVLSSAAALLSLVAAVVCSLLLVIAFNLGRLFPSIPLTIVAQARVALLIVGGSLAVAIPFSVLAGFCLGLEKNQINAAAATVSRVVSAGGILFAAIHHQGLVAMALWAAVGTLVQPIFFAIATHRFGMRSLLKRQLVCMQMARQFGGFCAAMMVSQFSMLLITGLDLPIVAAFDFRNAGYYALASLVSNMLVVPYGAVLLTIVPMMSSMSVGETPDRMGSVLLRTSRLASALLILAAVPLMLGMPLLLQVWVGQSYAEHTLLFGELLVGAQVIRLSLMPYSLIGFSAGEQSRMLASPLVEGAVNLVCSLVLVRYLGAAGVALGTVIGAVVGIAMHFLASMARTRSMTFRKRDLLWWGIIRPMGFALPPAALLAVLLPRIHEPGFKALALMATTALLVALFWQYHLEPDEQAIVKQLGVRLLRVRRPKPVGI